MAKLHSYYVLCPLIDQKSFLGVSKDKNSENVIVTLGRNVVNTYRLSDQKQIAGWTSKDHITSSVIYDNEYESYVAIFNNNTIKMWKDDIENLNKLKKYKFPMTILKIIQRDTQASLLVLDNGNCASLSYAIDNRKSLQGKSPLEPDSNIVDVECYTRNNIDYICYITKTPEEKYEIYNCPLRNEIGDLEKNRMIRTAVAREDSDVHVVGKLISTVENPVVYIMWSDSKIASYDLIKKSWKIIGTVPWISTLTSVSIAWMGKRHLILFGSDSHDDGAVIVAYNVSLGVGSCRYPMKMYCEDARLYCFYNRIILEASNHIGMLPYALEVSRSLSSLLGSHEVIQDECTEIANWGEGEIKLSVADNIQELLKIGLTERAICSQIVRPLIEKNDFKSMRKAMKVFRDVPESIIVSLLECIISSILHKKVELTNREKIKELCLKDHNKHKLAFVNEIFSITFSDALLIPHLRNNLSLDNAVFLLNYISFLLIDSDEKFVPCYETKLFDWCSLLMDAFYQQYLMTKDDKVTNALENMRNVIEELIRQLSVVDSMLPLIHKMIAKKNVDDVEQTLPYYTIELMEI